MIYLQNLNMQGLYKRNKGAERALESLRDPMRESVRARENQDVGGSQREPDETKGSQREQKSKRE